MVGNNRQLIRLSLIIVLLFASFGWWFGSNYWQLDAPSFGSLADAGTGDWVDVIASFADQLLLLFLDLASPEG